MSRDLMAWPKPSFNAQCKEQNWQNNFKEQTGLDFNYPPLG